eukprot:1596989-Rhodomonas_salina.1
MSGTELAYGDVRVHPPTRAYAMSSTELAYGDVIEGELRDVRRLDGNKKGYPVPIILRAAYALCGTDLLGIAYGLCTAIAKGRARAWRILLRGTDLSYASMAYMYFKTNVSYVQQVCPPPLLRVSWLRVIQQWRQRVRLWLHVRPFMAARASIYGCTCVRLWPQCFSEGLLLVAAMLALMAAVHLFMAALLRLMA